MIRKILCLVLGLGFLVGCQPPCYSMQMWLNDAHELLSFHQTEVIDYWQGLLKEKDLNRPVDTQSAVTILADILNVEKKDIVGLGYFSQIDFDQNRIVEKKEALSLLEKVKSELSTMTFLETKTYFQTKNPILGILENEIALTHQVPGMYEVDGTFYEVDEHQKISELALEDVVENLQIQTTFQPNLSECVIFPEGTVFDANIDDLKFNQKTSFMPLRSHYFHFNIGNYKISGRVFDSGVDVNIKKNDFHQMTLENQLSLSQLKVTADVSMNPLKDPHFLLRADYLLNDTLSLSRKEEIPLSKKILQSELYSNLKERLASLVKSEASTFSDLELLRFSMPVPGSLKSLKVDAVLSVGFLLNGEVELRFETSSHQGFQSNHGNLQKIQENKWSVEPYLDGSAELACFLSLELNLGKYIVADTSISSGVGADGSASIYYVDSKQKLVDKQEINASLSQIEAELNQYDMNSESYVDCCADIDVYCFLRLNVGNARKSLLRQLGLTYSFTPVKEHLRLLHIENHHVVPKCTRYYDFIDDKLLNQSLQISTYQIILYPNETHQLTSNVKVVSWESANSNVATVKDGLVMAHQKGETQIIATDKKGNQSVCLVIVLEEDQGFFIPLLFFLYFAVLLFGNI